jgi:hypothetical protein
MLTLARVSKALNMSWNTLSIIPCTLTISTQTRRGVYFQAWTK